MIKQTNRQFKAMKFNSSRLKKYNYDIKVDYQQGVKDGDVISLADNQILRTIRDVLSSSQLVPKNRKYNKQLLEKYYSDLKNVRLSNINSNDKRNRIKNINNKIATMMFIPEYVTVVMDSNSHYDHIQKKGFKVNGVKYKRLSTSASQGRVSTVSFCAEHILDEVNKRLDNGRDESVLLAPSKYNAYKGLYSSATKVVSEPRFCVVDDYSSDVTFMVNHVTTTDDNEDDLIVQKEITKTFDRFDGQGLISPEFAKVWANDLNLDYVPAEFCFRQSFMKGMLATFDFRRFCKEVNDGNYEVETIYKDENGNPKKVDLREIDVIITASQFKLWKSYKSQEEYVENYRKNKLYWGVSLYTDKQLKDVLTYNYQFLQVLNVKNQDIEKLCKMFTSWVKGVTYEDVYSTLLFLFGTNLTENGIKKSLESKDNYWVKALMLNHDLINDKWIRKKIYNLIKTRINNGCIGRIIVEGNNQTLVSDPYAMMQYITGQEVTGLLGKNEYYSKYWNQKGVDKVVGTRPPLTYRSEVTKLKLKNNDELNKWYKYLYGGIIVNVHGYETDLWAGSDDL